MIHLIPLSGFLGAGKTTTMLAAAKLLEAGGRRVAIITNDQGRDLVDTKLVRSALDAVGEVTGGCFCCKFEDLVEVISALAERSAADTVLAEAVGSCTDLQATVVRPLRRYHGDRLTVAPLTTVVEPLRYRAFTRAASAGAPQSDLAYLFFQQLAEADVLAVSKIDLLPAAEVEAITASIRAAYPAASVIPYSALTGSGLDELVAAWTPQAPAAARDLDVDYDRYAAAEAALAWLNQDIELRATAGDFDADRWALAVLEHLSRWAAARGVLIGHAKLTVEARGSMAKLSLTAAGAPPTADRRLGGRVTAATATVNARVACEPAELNQAVLAAVEHANAATGVHATGAAPLAFKPAYPRPLHRLPATAG